MKKIKKSVANIYSTGIFQNVNLELNKYDEDSVDVFVNLVEKGGDLKFSANFNTEVNASALITYQALNLFGAGIINNFSMLFNDCYQRISYDFISPRIFETLLANNLNLHLQRTNYPIYDDDKKVDEHVVENIGLSANIGLQIERVGITSIGINQIYYNVDQFRPDLSKAYSFNVTRIVGQIDVDNTNDYDLPTKGNRNSIIYEHSIRNENLEPYFKFSATTKNYETYDNVTFSTLLQLGYLSSANEYFEKFHIGGQNSFPGMNIYQKWGNMLFLYGMELRFPFTKGIYTNLQMKVGNVWDDLQEFKLSDFNWGAQAGIIVPTPIGPIRLEYGADIESHQAIYFSLGHNF